MVPVIPDTAPFTLEQRAWLNGYLAGLFARAPIDAIASKLAAGTTSAAGPALTPLTILFGSQTGTAEGLAKRAAKEAGKRGFVATVLDMAQTDAAMLAQEKNLLVITSTYGDGEPPDNAKALHAALASDSAPALANLLFSICALGDTNYTQFCKCGADFDALLEKRGATRVAPRADCDLDFEANFSGWLDRALAAFESGKARVTSDETKSDTAEQSLVTRHSSLVTGPGYCRARPFPSLVLASRNLNGTGSAKQVHHVEFSLEGSALVYETGDALGVLAHNCPKLVADILAALGCDGEEAVPAPDGSMASLRRALTELYDVGKPSAELLAMLAPAAVGRIPDSSCSGTPHHVIDLLLLRADVRLAPVDFVRALRRLQPRLYSISSSPRAHPAQVHLTVGAVRYELAGRARKGVCSTFLADRVVPGETRLGTFVHPNQNFRPPANGDTPMIMVGPGTGIAPFRAFLEERRATGARGKNWLFFGDQRAATDFLYRDELLAFQAEGTLTRLDLAWSRDQGEKIYVQHRMREHAAEMFAWLERGAHFYVCGDATRMARDVDAALHKIVEIAGKMSADDAASYVQALKTAKRYARDVY